jgi:hypothetical protein
MRFIKSIHNEIRESIDQYHSHICSRWIEYYSECHEYNSKNKCVFFYKISTTYYEHNYHLRSCRTSVWIIMQIFLIENSKNIVNLLLYSIGCLHKNIVIMFLISFDLQLFCNKTSLYTAYNFTISFHIFIYISKSLCMHDCCWDKKKKTNAFNLTKNKEVTAPQTHHYRANRKRIIHSLTRKKFNFSWSTKKTDR